MRPRISMAFALSGALFCLTPAGAHTDDPAIAAASDDMARAAEAWLAHVDRSQAVIGYAEAERLNWHYTPRRRLGVPFKAMSAEARRSAEALIAATLSAEGTEKVRAIRELEAILGQIERGGSLVGFVMSEIRGGSFRDPENYDVTIFGTPGQYPWGWRIEGHHLSVNVAVAAAGHVTLTPLFTGSNPARIPEGPRRDERIMADEYRLARDLMASLDADQRRRAVLGDRSFGDIVAGPGRDALLSRAPEGLPAAAMTDAQRDMLLALVRTYVGAARDAFERPYMDAVIAAGVDKLHFAWAGDPQAKAAHYYRVHGSRILIEYDNTQDDANHVHAVWRDPIRDWGRDALEEHYRAAPPTHRHGENRATDR